VHLSARCSKARSSRNLSARSRLCRRARAVSDIVKRRSIRAPHVIARSRAARYLHQEFRNRDQESEAILMLAADI
jgi:hypothetical protein